MTILSADLIFFAAENQNDESYGGGGMSANVVQDGVSANVFPLIGEADANIGRVQLRKAYAAVLSANTDLLVNAAVHVRTPPVDALVEVLLFAWGNQSTTRDAAAAALAAFPYYAESFSVGFGGTVSGSGLTRTFANETSIAVGDVVLLGVWDLSFPFNPIPMAVEALVLVTAKSGASVTYQILGSSGSNGPITHWLPTRPSAVAPRCCGVAEVAVSSSIGATTVSLSRTFGRVIPDVTPYPASPPGIASSGLRMVNGLVPIFRVGEMVQIRNAAGTVSEVALVENVDHFNDELTFAEPLANAYASGSLVSSLVQLGDLQAQAGSSFSQQTWTRVFSDAIIGNSIGANYNRTAAQIAVTNEGAETERWAIVFTNATDFRLIGERFGQIAAGDTSVDFLPLNPITNQPYFTIPAAGWGTGWAAGNVLRFNTTGARAPFWAMRTISPVPTETTDGAVFEFRGSF